MTDEQELLNERATNILTKLGSYVTVSLGLIFLSFIVPAIYDGTGTDDLKALFLKYGILLFAYVAAMVFCYVAARRHIFGLHRLTQWVYLPVVGVFFAYEAFQLFMEFRNDGN